MADGNAETDGGALLAMAAAVAGILLGQPAIVQELPQATLLSNAVRQPWIRFELSFGPSRLEGHAGQCRPSSSAGSGTRRERLTIRAARHRSHDRL